MIAPEIDPAYFLKVKNNKLTKNILATQSIAGMAKNFQSLLINTKPKCERCVNANAALSTNDAFLSPIDFAKLE